MAEHSIIYDFKSPTPFRSEEEMEAKRKNAGFSGGLPKLGQPSDASIDIRRTMITRAKAFPHPGGGHLRAYPVGSRWTCDPPPMDTDEDYIVYAGKTLAYKLDTKLSNMGFTTEGEDHYGNRSDFKSYRSGEINLIVATSLRFVNLFLKATDVCLRLNLLDKDDRIEIFDIIMEEDVI